MAINKETIVCAAGVHNGVTYTVPRPGRHDKVIAVVSKANPDCKVLGQGTSWQGFLTSTGRFVNRIEGAEIAKAAEQIIDRETGELGDKLNWPPLLYSEDMW